MSKSSTYYLHHQVLTKYFTSPAGSVAKYCNERVCVCVSVLLVVEIPQGQGQFGGIVQAFKSISNLRCNGRGSVEAKWSIQSPITSCCRRDHSVCQAGANSILKMHCM